MHDFVRITGAIPLLLLLRPKRLYASKAAKKKIRGGALLASNHLGWADSMSLMAAIWYRRHHFVMMKELFDKRVPRFWFSKACMCLPIDRTTANLDEIKNIISHLKNEELVTIFPEGSINEDGSGENMAKFKSGVALFAVKSGKPIVPVYMLKRKRKLSRLIIAIGDPIYVDEEERKKAPRAYLDNLAQQVYDKTLELEELCKSYKQKKDKKKKETT